MSAPLPQTDLIAKAKEALNKIGLSNGKEASRDWVLLTAYEKDGQRRQRKSH